MKIIPEATAFEKSIRQAAEVVSMAEEGDRGESGWNKDVVKEALAELLNEMPMFKDLTAGSFSQPGPAGAGPLSNQPVTREASRSGKSISINL